MLSLLLSFGVLGLDLVDVVGAGEVGLFWNRIFIVVVDREVARMSH